MSLRVAIVRRERGNALSMDVYADNLIAELQKVRPDWNIVEVAPRPWSKDSADSWHSGNPIRKYFERFWHYPRTVSKYEADLFHIIDHTDGHIAYWLKKLNKPVIVTCHDLVQFVYPEILKDQARIPALSMATWRYSVKGMQQADRIVAVSTNTAKDVTQMLQIATEQVTVVPNGVDAQFKVLTGSKVEARRKSYSSSPELCLLNVGSTHQRKNMETILQVLEVLRNKNVPVRLWKVGSEFTAKQKAYISDRQLESCITFIPYPDRTTLVEIYNAADILLAPSLYEGFGLTILEAMACGTPVITSNVSSLPEVTNDAAILVNPLDVSAIVEGILQLQQDSSWRDRLIEKGLLRAKQFTWKQTAETIALNYEKLGLTED